MKKNAGFTLIEMLVGMLVMVIIMAALVSLFSSSVQSEMTGFRQQEVYAQARAVVNDLKTTLRYADSAAVFYDGSGNKIASPTYDNTKTASKAEYTATIYNSNKAVNEAVGMKIEWLDSTKKQLKITKTIDGTAQPELKFPKSVDNSVFKGDGSDFPLYINQSDASLYQINLPYKYKFGFSDEKTDALVTDILKATAVNAGNSASGAPPILLMGGDLTFVSPNAMIRTDSDDVTLVFKTNFVNVKNNGNLSSSKFKTLTNNSGLMNNSGKIEVVDQYDGMDIDAVIERYSRVAKYNFSYKDNVDRYDLWYYPLEFGNDETIQAYRVSWDGVAGTVLTVSGTNAIYASGTVTIKSYWGQADFALRSGEKSGALIIYSKSAVNLTNLRIPKEIAVLIYSDSAVNITNSTLENAMVLSAGSCKISSSEVYGTVECAGSALQIDGKCTFGKFKGTPTAMEVFDAMLL